MLKKMLINASHPEECRVAVVCDGMLEELDVQVGAHEATLGNIYKAVVSRIEPSLQAVFVDYGAHKNGFLSINDVHPSYFPESFEGSRRRPRIQDVFKKDDHVLVQVNKEERAHKGASLTTNISIAGRYLVLMPGTDLYGVSRKIEDEKERKKLKEIVKQLKMPPNMGFIIRTAGMGRTKTELSRDLEYLLKLWGAIEGDVADLPAPAILYKEHDLVIRSIREHFSPEISEILVDDNDVYKRIKDFFHQVMPKYESSVKSYQEKRPLFNKYQLEEQIECVYRRKIKLKSGGHIVIEPTEALVSIDVNSGSSTKEKGVEDTAFRVNMEAAPEIARQLRLRDLGGIIAVDFIDMSQKKHNQDLERELKAHLKNDRAKNKVLRISALGVLELSRQRLKSSLGTGEYLDCPHCDGQGKLRSPETSALSVFRRIKSLVLKSDVNEVRVTVPAKTAEYLLNNMRSQLVELENVYSTKISILMRQHLPDKDTTIEGVKDEGVREEHIREEVVDAVRPESALVDQIAAEPLVEESIESAAEESKPELKPKRPRQRRRKKKEAEREFETQNLAEVVENVSIETQIYISQDAQEVPDHLAEVLPTSQDNYFSELFSIDTIESLPAEEPTDLLDMPTADLEVVAMINEQPTVLSSDGAPDEDPSSESAIFKENDSGSNDGTVAKPAIGESMVPETEGPGESDTEKAPTDEVAEEKKTSKSKDRSSRKSLLQSYLPYS